MRSLRLVGPLTHVFRRSNQSIHVSDALSPSSDACYELRANLSQAVRISSGHLLIDAIDHRAAAYEKLGKLQAALKDSKQMIDFRPNIAKVCMST